MATLDEKIKSTIDRIAFLIVQIPIVTADGQISAHAYNVAMEKGDSIGADINRNANITANGKLANFKAELEQLNKPVSGILALLQAQKQVAINAQQKIVDSSLTAQQKADLQKAEISAEASKPAPNNTTKYIIIAVVVVVVVVAGIVLYFKSKK